MQHPTEPPHGLPLSGLRVLDFAQFLAGPAAALRLADLGADVIKVERPKGGDACRNLIVADQTFEGDSLLFHTINRNKRSFAADLKDPADLEQVKSLIETADVLIQNFRPGVMDRIGLGYEAIAKLNPELVYASVTGYGVEGPWVGKPGQDLLAQSLSGMTWLSGNASDGPVPVGFAMLDIATAGNLTQGILAALVQRGITRKGALVEVDLMSTAFDLQFEHLTAFFNDDCRLPERSAVSNGNVYGAAPYGIYQTADGNLALAMMPVDQVAKLFDSPDIGAFDQSQAYASRDKIKTILAGLIRERSTKHWLSILEPQDVWCAPVLDWPDLVAHDGFRALQPMQTITGASGNTAQTTRCPIRIDGRHLTTARGAPALGQHTDEIRAQMTGD